MAPRESAAMSTARVLITVMGKTPYAAAKQVGLTAASIYMAPWYKEWKKNEQAK